MTNPQEPATRPISVAELLAKNGTIGAAPPGGRRRRRRGNSDSVTVAELTGEIPIVGAADDELAHAAPVEPEPELVDEPETVEPEAVESETDEPESDEAETVESADESDEADDAARDAADEPAADAHADEADEAEYEAHLQQRAAEPAPLEFTAPRRRPPVATPTGFSGAEAMSPDPAVDDAAMDDADIDLDFAEMASGANDFSKAQEDLPSYLRSSSDTLFGGQSVADDAARRGRQPGPEDIDLGEAATTTTIDTDAAAAEQHESGGSAVVRGALVVGQCILAVAFGAGLFVAFDQLWRWNNIVALVLSVLVILGLVVGVRVVRKTEDIGSTLIAVAVGALVTLGPLALLQSH
jgi:hypothetical protein